MKAGGEIPGLFHAAISRKNPDPFLNRPFCGMNSPPVTGYSGTAYPVYFDLRNNLFLNGTVALTYYTTNSYVWSIRDNLFDGVALTVSSSGTNIAPANSNNGYYNTTNLTASSGGDVALATVDYQTGPRGNYYYPASGTNLFSLVNAGSRTADLARLFHYTTQVSQAKETNSVVDIGYHSVAVDPNGNPIDTDSDGIQDYMEDHNGNDTYDAGDLANFTSSDTDGDGVNDYLEYIQGRNPRIVGTASDTNQVVKLRVYTPLK